MVLPENLTANLWFVVCGLGFVAIEDLGLTRRLGLQLSVGLDERLSGALVAALRDAEAAQMAIPDANVSIN